MEIKNREIIDSTEALEKALVRVRKAQKEYSLFTQEQVDKIFFAAASAARRSARSRSA